MRKVLLSLILTFITTLTLGLGLTACAEKPEEHVCVFNKQVTTQTYCISPATCTQKAKYHFSCECGKMSEETFEVGSALGHLFTVYLSNNDATCEENGTKTATCNRNCGAVDTITDVDSALGHNYLPWMSNGNNTHSKICINDSKHTITENCSGGEEVEGYRKICSFCNSEYGERKGHTYVTVVTPPTCTENGYTTHTCACGDKYVTDEIPALEHDYSGWTSTGNDTHVKICANDTSHVITGNCSGGEEIEGQRKVCSTCNSEYGEVIGHKYTSTVTEPTCEDQGYTTHTCACGHTYVDNYVDALGHNYGDWLFSSEKGHYKVCANNNSHVIYVGVSTDKVLYSADDKQLDFYTLKTALAKHDVDIFSLDDIDSYTVNNNTVNTLVLDVIITGDGKARKVDTAQTVTVNIDDKSITLTNVYAYTKIIDNAEDLKYFTLDGVRQYNEIDGYFIVTQDIDAKDLVLSEHVFDRNLLYPSTAYNKDVGFRGVFDGQGHYIDNLTVKSAGLFGSTNAPVIKNVAFTNATLTGYYTTLFAQQLDKARTASGTYTNNEGEISNVYVSIKSIARTSTNKYIGLLINRVMPDVLTISNVIVDYTNVSEDIQTYINNGNSFYMFGSTGSSMATVTSMYKNCYAISTAPVLSNIDMPGFAENQVEYTLTNNVVTAVGKVLNEQVNTILTLHNKTLSVEHVIVGLRAYDSYASMLADKNNAQSLKTFSDSCWIVVNGIPYWKTTYFGEEMHSYTEEIVMPAALKTPATCTQLAIYYKSCACGKVGNDDTFEGGKLDEHYYVCEVVNDETLKTQGTDTTPSVFYRSCVCGKVIADDTNTFELEKTMLGKNVLIFGDSYSSYIGTIPEPNYPYYKGDNILSSPDQMWWSLLVKERGGNIVRNDSSSGSTIGYTGYYGTDYYNTQSSFISRLEKLIENGFFEDNPIDVVYVFGGTNDSWCGADLGEEMYENWTKEDLYNVLPAICYFYSRLREILPNAEIYGLANCGLQEEIITAIDNACKTVNAKSVILENIDTQNSHPTELGMQQIKNQVIQVFDN
ncbi:MAG: hypothetical protein IKL82_00355 [Clostridia bacterium]|nr:hypothetical protein [Clostridia bacterium]